MMTWLFIGAAVVAQCARVIVNDTILDRPRRWWGVHLPSWWVKLLGCPWCVTAWLSAAVTVPLAVTNHAPLPGLWWLAQWRLAIILYWVGEALARYGVDSPIEYKEI